MKTDPKMYYMMELADKHFKIAIITILKDVKEDALQVHE